MAAASGRAITAVFFDFGGTLFSYSDFGAAPADAPLFVRAAERLGVAADRKTIGRAYAVASKEAFQQVGTQPYYLHRDLFLTIFRGFAQHLGAVADDEFLEWFYDGQREMLLSSFALRADCLETLTALREEGLYLSIVSNIDDDYLHPMVERAGLERVLHHWTSSEEARRQVTDRASFGRSRATARPASPPSTPRSQRGYRCSMVRIANRESHGFPSPGPSTTSGLVGRRSRGSSILSPNEIIGGR